MKHETIYLREGRTDVTLTTYVLNDSPETLNGKKRPAVVVCPGGAYLSCSDREGEPIALAFANMGYHAFVLRYGVYQENRPGMFFPEPGTTVPVKEHCVHPNPIRDIARAFLEIHAHAEEWHVDVDKIAVCGFSAGAHNSAMYATRWHEPVLSDYFGVPAETFKPAACILGYTLSDYIYMKSASMGDDPMAEGLFKVSNIALIGTDSATDEQLADVSPAMHVTKNTPPTFLWATSEDTLVPVQHTLIMARALADEKIPFEVHVFENGPHGLSTATQSAAAAKSSIMPDVAQWLPMCATWLEKRFALDLPARTIWEEMGV